MFTPTILTVAVRSVSWTPTIAIIMILCNVAAIWFTNFHLDAKDHKDDPQMPAANFFGEMGAPAVLGTWCFGHMLGAGAILGLTQLGVL